ncbi:hypothetical protein CYMTET_44204 [Cymbomonas tetramitiformis]|uniref:Uncharacterized protein n=1 Tax=Cymbomonas tetramitiformis TaxID=36881 RepID=A0AAE0C1W0_9CHLO|nr:hypothetical protein CYMTET_44204 [Cymbomonas tetramitiformis]
MGGRNYGSTPLHCAALEGYTASVQALIEAGADKDAQDTLCAEMSGAVVGVMCGHMALSGWWSLSHSSLRPLVSLYGYFPLAVWGLLPVILTILSLAPVSGTIQGRADDRSDGIDYLQIKFMVFQ